MYQNNKRGDILQKKIKNLIIFLIILVIVLGLVIQIVNKRIYDINTNNKILELNLEREEFEKMEENPSSIIDGKKLEEVKAEGIYLTIGNIVSKYVSYVAKRDANAIYNVLYKDYMNKNNIQQENIFRNIDIYSNYETEKMLGISTSTYGIYYVKINSDGEEKYILINWDTKNDTFSVCPINENDYKNSIEIGISVDKERIAPIEENEYNKVEVESINQDKIAKKYFQDYITKLLYQNKKAYNMLDEDYKNAAFENYESFLEYVDKNKQRFESLDRSNVKTSEDFQSDEEYQEYIQERLKFYLADYAQKTEKNIKKYIFKDSYGNYYTFKVSAAFQYTVILDNYTIPAEDFIENYNSRKDEEKVVLNIKKFFMGIDDKNYGYAYNLLAESFRNNKYPTKNDFIAYAEKNFYEKNKIEYINYTEENGVYIYKIKISDATVKSAETKQFNMIIRLKEGTDFEMSFSQI